MNVDAWIAIAALAMFVYVALDGYDLGIGILMVGQDDAGRREWTSLVNTRCDGNESWIVLVGALLLAGVPGAYDVLLPILYVPVGVTVVSLIARRVALVMMRSASSTVASGDRASLLFAAGSLLAAFSQGVAVTALAEWASWSPDGSRAADFDFLSWYSVLGGLTAIAVYAVAGAVWAAHKADAPVQEQARRMGAIVMPLAAGLVALSAGLLPTTPTTLPTDWDGRLLFVGGAVLVGSTMGIGWSSKRHRAWLVAAAIVAIEVVALGIIVGLRLAEMLPRPTNSQVGEPTSALYLLLIAIAPCMPIVLFLNGYAVWRFRQKLAVSGAPPIAAVHSLDPELSPIQVAVGV